VKRYDNITIRYFDLSTGNIVEKEYTGFSSRVIQHEYDHLNGILYIDKASNININNLAS
jgi:peptide deformylase